MSSPPALRTFATRTFVNPVNAKVMDSAAKSANIDDARAGALLRSCVSLSVAEWAHLSNKEFWFSREDALKSG